MDDHYDMYEGKTTEEINAWIGNHPDDPTKDLQEAVNRIIDRETLKIVDKMQEDIGLSDNEKELEILKRTIYSKSETYDDYRTALNRLWELQKLVDEEHLNKAIDKRLKELGQSGDCPLCGDIR
jgi:hypothetical protein